MKAAPASSGFMPAGRLVRSRSTMPSTPGLSALQSDVSADVEGLAHQEFAAQDRQFQMSRGVRRQQPHRSQGRQQHDGRTLRQAEVAAQRLEGARSFRQMLEDAEMSDGRRQQLGAVVTAKVIENRRGIERRHAQRRQIHGSTLS